MPFGRKPPWLQRLEKLAVSPRAPIEKTITARPTRISPTIVTILIIENQNSNSPNSLTAIRLAA